MAGTTTHSDLLNSFRRMCELRELCAPQVVDHLGIPRRHWILPVQHVKEGDGIQGLLDKNIEIIEEAVVLWAVNEQPDKEQQKARQMLATLKELRDLASLFI